MKRKKKRKKRKIFILITILVLILLISISTIFIITKIKDKNKTNIKLTSNLDIEINTDVNLLSLIDNIENGEILSKDTKIDTSNLGKQKIDILIKDKNNKEETYTFEINIIDTTKPTIEGKDDITGYMHESWHLRYVGIDLATKLYNNGDWITLEEYFGIDSKYNY